MAYRTAPDISVYEENGKYTSLSYNWIFKVGGDSTDVPYKVLWIWNNKGGNTTIPDLQEPELVMYRPGYDDDVIDKGWVKAKTGDPADTGYTPLYENSGLKIGYKPTSNSIPRISGKYNTGDVEDDTTAPNRQKVTIFVDPDGADTKTYWFEVRIKGYY